VEVVAGSDGPADEEWSQAFGPDEPRRHQLSLEQVELVAGAYHARGGDFDAAVRRLASGRLEHLARRIRPARSWDDLVLSPERTALLLELTARYRHAERVYHEWGFPALPSRGMVALFSGPSGTGKTLAAEVVAGDLGLDVFKLDLSSVVSKYIGETEKNLEEVFEAAEAGNLVLFFDEADALFGKRSEVKDARDRYANIEVSYLLQRLEAYDGLVILATNFERNLDEAFLRRIHTRIEFTVPTEVERKAIWAANLPAGAPLGDVDTAELAKRFELTGGAIRNAALRAAFAAAAADGAITTERLVQAVAREFQKMGRLVHAGDFAPYTVDEVAPADG
jgi:SpoVK/Ycf46/Vps4 family AAA+-type ATPase